MDTTPVQTLLLQHEGGVLTITLNRPEVRNAMSLGMVLELREALAAAEADGHTRVIVLRGAGGHVVRFDDHTPLAYGKSGWDNPFFIAYAPGVELKK